MLLRLNRLPEDGVASAILLFHGACGVVEIIESLGLDGGNMRNHSLSLSIDFQDRTTTRASQIEILFLPHGRNDKSNLQEPGGTGWGSPDPCFTIAAGHARYTLPMLLEAIFFDVGNTLLFPNRKKMLHAIHSRQIFPSEELLARIERETKHEFDSLVETHAEVDHGFWWMFYTRLLGELGIPDQEICKDLVARTQTSANWCDLRPGTREALRRLRERYRLAVISNADGKIADVLEHCGIADCFETITDSGIVGKEKPHPAIFEAALQSLGVRAAQSLYTGDVYCIDYLGSTAIGMQCVLFDVPGAYAQKGLPRVRSLEELEDLLSKRR